VKSVDKDKLQPWQSRRIHSAIYPCVNYLVRLKKRMEATGFPQDDLLYQLVIQAYDAVHRLYTELHYLSCQSGVGRTERGK
jgi:hypothetical protein